MVSNLSRCAVRTTNSDIQQNGRVVIVTHPRKDIPPGTARSIYSQADWPKG